MGCPPRAQWWFRSTILLSGVPLFLQRQRSRVSNVVTETASRTLLMILKTPGRPIMATTFPRFRQPTTAAPKRRTRLGCRLEFKPDDRMSLSQPILLVVDDDPGIVALVERFAQPLAFTVLKYTSARAALSSLPDIKPDIALVDLQMPDVNGLDVLRQIRATLPACQVSLMTGNASVDTAIEAVKLGALDYLTKPLDFDRLRELLITVRKSVERRETLLRVDAELAKQFEFYGMIGRSPVMQELFDLIRRLAPHVRTALVTGETGTGKELVSRALHKLGTTRARPLVVANCSAVVETLFESELFGHVRGAFTGATESKAGLFEQADGGTLFLDEIGELPLAMQAKLLRVVEYGEVQRVGATQSRRVDVRVITATNRDLLADVQLKRFRQDLYYRLNIVEIALPPLRERREDIPYLTAAFVKEFAKRFNKPISGMSAGAERLLQNAPWPGNIRELRNTVERACMLTVSQLLSDQDVRSAFGAVGRPAADVPQSMPPAGPKAPPHPELDRQQVQQALQRAGGNKSAAARALGVSRRALYRRLDEFGLR
jgi:two-component system response regulator HydG